MDEFNLIDDSFEEFGNPHVIKSEGKKQFTLYGDNSYSLYICVYRFKVNLNRINDLISDLESLPNDEKTPSYVGTINDGPIIIKFGDRPKNYFNQLINSTNYRYLHISTNNVSKYGQLTKCLTEDDKNCPICGERVDLKNNILAGKQLYHLNCTSGLINQIKSVYNEILEGNSVSVLSEALE